MRLISTLLFIGIIMVPLISSQTTSSSEDDFTLPTLAELRANIKELWENYKKGFGLVFKTTAEEIHRIRIFNKHLKMIIKHNLEYDLGLHSYRLGVANHTELTNEEFREKFYGYKKDEKLSWSNSESHVVFTPTPTQTTLPMSIDWRDQKIVTSVKDQGQCGSCWAFSTLGALEAYYARATGKLVDLSEQQLVDCSRKYNNEGCNGGYPAQAFRYIFDNKGITYEESYPYLEKDGASCKSRDLPVAATVDGIVSIPRENERALQEALALHGPVVVAIDASLESFRFYKSGVYSDRQCSPRNLNHAVLAVGYGVEFNPIKGRQEFYIVKNSWSSMWGDKGYIKIARNSNNMCGICSDAVYPIVNSKMMPNETNDD